jgi:Cu/Zn superoxide dismutase
VRRFIRVALGGLAGCALILGASQAANGDSANMTYPIQNAEIGDFQEAIGPFDEATGTLRVMQAPDDAATGFKLTVNGIDPSAAGKEFGAHLHIGPCIDGDYDGIPTNPVPGGKAGPHYNHDAALGLPLAVNPQTEVWFNLVPSDHGDATDDTKVNFVPRDANPDFIPGKMSIVIHVLPTNTEFGIPTAGKPAGYAGDRQACFKLLTPNNWVP